MKSDIKMVGEINKGTEMVLLGDLIRGNGLNYSQDDNDVCQNHNDICQNHNDICQNHNDICQNHNDICQNHNDICQNHNDVCQNHNDVCQDDNDNSFRLFYVFTIQSDKSIN